MNEPIKMPYKHIMVSSWYCFSLKAEVRSKIDPTISVEAVS